MATPAVTSQAATAWDEQGNPVQPQQPAATGATAWDENGNPVKAPPPSDINQVNSDIQTEGALRDDVVGAAKSVANVATAPAVHLKNAITSLAHGEYSDAAMHFLHSFTDDPAGQIVDQQLQSSSQAKDRMIEAGKNGDALGVAQHAAGMIPGASQVDAAMTNYQKEPSRANLVHIMTTALPLLIPGAVKGASDISEAIPSAERAGASLGEVKEVAGDVSLSGGKLGKLSDTVGEIMKQDERGAPAPAPVKQLAKRLESGEPLKYEEAKDFQSNISALSVEEKMGMSPNTKRLVGQLNQDLKGALEDAADTKGKGEQFVQSMKEYHNAMRLKEMSDTAKAAAIKAGIVAAFGATGGAGYALYKKLFD